MCHTSHFRTYLGKHLYHKTPDGNTREQHPDTGDTHHYPGDTIPWYNK